MAYSSQLLFFNILVNLICSPQSFFPFRKKSYQICQFPVFLVFHQLFMITQECLLLVNQSHLQLLLVSQDGIFFWGRRLRESNEAHSDSCFSCFSFPLQMFATDVLVQNFSSFVKNTATTRWQHPCDALINTIAAQAVSQPRAVSCVPYACNKCKLWTFKIIIKPQLTLFLQFCNSL